MDLFAGCGGLALGAHEAARRHGFSPHCAFASEWNPDALEIFKQNIDPKDWDSASITDLMEGDVGALDFTTRELRWLKRLNGVELDLLTGGPPCQGHSDLNNHTRRNDPRNSLYLRMARAAQIFKPKLILIENVATVIHAHEDVVNITKTELLKLNYHVAEFTISSWDLGVPQTRRRHFILASLTGTPELPALMSAEERQHRTVDWAIDDLRTLSSMDAASSYDRPARSSTENQRRMQWLIDNNAYDLPDEHRPSCHRDKAHNYPAVYGRLHGDEPAPTITSGFAANGQGRFTHPNANPGRPLTPHEAARIQTFPDWFDFGERKRKVYSTTIGNAVPPLMAMRVTESLLKTLP